MTNRQKLIEVIQKARSGYCSQFISSEDEHIADAILASGFVDHQRILERLEKSLSIISHLKHKAYLSQSPMMDNSTEIDGRELEKTLLNLQRTLDDVKRLIGG